MSKMQRVPEMDEHGHVREESWHHLAEQWLLLDIFDKNQTPEGVVGGELWGEMSRDAYRRSEEDQELAKKRDDVPFTVKHFIKWWSSDRTLEQLK